MELGSWREGSLRDDLLQQGCAVSLLSIPSGLWGVVRQASRTSSVRRLRRVCCVSVPSSRSTCTCVENAEYLSSFTSLHKHSPGQKKRGGSSYRAKAPASRAHKGVVSQHEMDRTSTDHPLLSRSDRQRTVSCVFRCSERLAAIT